MEQVVIANPKGGCGKTTIAANLAAYYASKGSSVLLLDHDSQRSSSDWIAVRPATCPKIQLRRVKESESVGQRLDEEYDYIVHDMPAAWTLKKIETDLSLGAKVIFPVIASPTDIRACFRFIMTLHREGAFDLPVQMALVANRARIQTRYYQVLTDFTDRLELPLVATLRDTQNYVRAMDRGLSIFDLPEGRVKKDIEQWQPLLKWLASV